LRLNSFITRTKYLNYIIVILLKIRGFLFKVFKELEFPVYRRIYLNSLPD